VPNDVDFGDYSTDQWSEHVAKMATARAAAMNNYYYYYYYYKKNNNNKLRKHKGKTRRKNKK